ncbi:MAG: histidine kinase dimerization/phosphoacceptor domain -containing protein, partial [Acetobacteraceae bacterium]
MERQVQVTGGRVTSVAVRPPDTTPAKKAASHPGARGRPRKRSTRSLVSGAPQKTEAADPVMLVRELNHRVKNNLQIIVSLMNLRKRMMPPERREDIRFIEEHVQSMSVAYRLVYATGSMVEVSLTDLITEVLSGLRQIAGFREESLQIDGPATDALIGLDHAIALALYLAVLLPPYLDEAIAASGNVTISITAAAGLFTLSVRGTWNTQINLDFLRSRLMQAYAAQLKGEIMPAAAHGTEQLRFALERPVGTMPA